MSDGLDRLTAGERAELEGAHAAAEHDLPVFIGLAVHHLRAAGGDQRMGTARLTLWLDEHLDRDAAIGVASLALVELARREPS